MYHAVEVMEEDQLSTPIHQRTDPTPMGGDAVDSYLRGLVEKIKIQDGAEAVAEEHTRRVSGAPEHRAGEESKELVEGPTSPSAGNITDESVSMPTPMALPMRTLCESLLAHWGNKKCHDLEGVFSLIEGRMQKYCEYERRRNIWNLLSSVLNESRENRGS